jgi:hypothetical protein
MMGATITIVIKGGTLAAIPVIAYSVLSLAKPWLGVLCSGHPVRLLRLATRWAGLPAQFRV